MMKLSYVKWLCQVQISSLFTDYVICSVVNLEFMHVSETQLNNLQKTG